MVARGYPGLTTCGGIFCGSMGEFIDGLSVFVDVQTSMVVECFGIIHVMEEAQKMRLTNVWLQCCVAFTARNNVS